MQPPPAPAVLRQLQTLDDLVRQGRWQETLADYQQLTFTQGDTLIPLDNQGELFWPLRRVCQQRLQSLPVEARKEAALLVEQTAAAWLAEAQRTRNFTLLRRVVEEASCSTVAPTAWNYLGDAAAQQGHWAEAERCWQQARNQTEITARLQAKILLAQLEQDRGQQFADGVALLAQQHPTAAGNLAGRSGTYGDILKAIAATRRPLQEHRRDVYQPWFLLGTFRPSPSPSVEAPPLLGRHLLFAAGNKIMAFSLETGQTQEWYALPQLVPPQDANLLQVNTCGGGVLLTLQASDRTLLLCLDGRPQGNLRWRQSFAGKVWARPVGNSERLFLGVQGEILALELATGVTCWRKSVPLLATQEIAPGHLRLMGPRLFISQPLLGLWALDVAEGRSCWLRRVRLDSPANWLVTEREVFVAPTTEERITRLDPATGQVRWHSASLPTRQLLGVTTDLLLVAREHQVRALERDTGRIMWRKEMPATAGRGCVCGESLLWPTAAGLRILNVNDGELAVDPQVMKRLPAGECVRLGDRISIVTSHGWQVYRW
jgi:outer membrane protein assembly factor BamB